jgi:hypothetical protein
VGALGGFLTRRCGHDVTLRPRRAAGASHADRIEQCHGSRPSTSLATGSPRSARTPTPGSS